MQRNVIVRSKQRPPTDLVDRLAGAGVATVHEAMGRRGLLSPDIRPIQTGVSVAGAAVTVLCQPGDNLMIHAAVAEVTAGDVLVVATRSPSTDGMIGELLATSLRVHGCVAVVIDAGVRDVAELRSVGFPVWARAISAQGTVKATGGSVNVPVTCGGALVSPGDVVVADDDGVAIVPRSDAASVAELSDQRIAREATMRSRLQGGELGIDIYGLRDRFEDFGITYVD